MCFFSLMNKDKSKCALKCFVICFLKTNLILRDDPTYTISNTSDFNKSQIQSISWFCSLSF